MEDAGQPTFAESVKTHALSTGKILFAGDDLTVTASLRGGETVVIAFSNHFSGPGPSPAFAEHYLTKNDISSINLTATRNHWWQTKERHVATREIRRYVASFERVVTYGSSMGGYGALAWASDVLATKSLVIGPQTVITDPAVRLNRQWREQINRYGIVRDAIDKDLPGGLVPDIYFDPRLDLDLQHVRWLQSRRLVNAVPFPFATHDALETFRQIGILRSGIADTLRGQLAPIDFKRSYRAGRSRSFNYLSAVAKHAALNGKLLTARRYLQALTAIHAETNRKNLYAQRYAALEALIAKREAAHSRQPSGLSCSASDKI